MPNGVNDILIKNDVAGISFTLPVNPQSIKWDGEVVVNKQDTKAGYHYQFIKYRRTNGQMMIVTGAARNKTFKLPGDNSKTVNNAFDYMMTLGSIIEYWMKQSVNRKVGPLQLIDNYNPQFPVRMDILFTSFPGFGPEAAKTSYEIPLTFEILNDYVDNFDMSTVDVDVIPALARAKDVAYTTKEGDTVDKLAMKFYGNTDMGILIQQLAQNDPYIQKNGHIKPGVNIIIPYAPLDKETLYKPNESTTSGHSKNDQLSSPVAALFSTINDGLSDILNW